MIVQHNMQAANANRMLGQVVTSQSKSTEKLSSGYRINRAADDAAGLSISEKMRGQIRGLNQASTNAQDGISLIQTAEGALSETHSILQRMRELSVQAANGTETDDDRTAVQDEISQLQEELTRIADTTEFNTMKLLNGNLAGGTATKGIDVNLKLSTQALADGALSTTPAASGVYETATVTDTDTVAATDLATHSFSVSYTDADGEKKTIDIKLTFDDTKDKFVSEDGEREYDATTAAPTNAEFLAAVKGELEKTELNNLFTIDDNSGTKLSFTAKEAGTNGAVINSVAETHDGTAAGQSVTVTTEPAEAYQSIATGAPGAGLSAYDGGDSKVEDYIFEVNGQKFAFVTAAGEEKLKNSEYSDINYVVTATTTPNTTAGGDVDKMASLISTRTGIDAAQDGTTGKIDLKATKDTKTAANGMTLQIGANEGQTMSFNIEDMSAKALGVADNRVDLSTQDGAKKATTIIDEAIKIVSAARGRMGAIQNRLEHTIANLDTSSENLQTAESRIRDVDMAEEMVTYSKNNIIQQAAQSMLAQANQSTQGVLSLLQ